MNLISAVRQNNAKIKMKSRLNILILFICFFSLCYKLTGSEPEKHQISFHFNNEPLTTVLRQLSDKHNFNFVFDDALIDDIVVACDVVRESPNTALKKLLRPYQLSHEFLNQNTIIIRRIREQVKPCRLLNGQVSDAETGLPLVFANAYIQGKNIGSATDINGHFTFEIPDSTFQLVVSYIGYDTKISQITPESNKVDIRLHPRPLEFNSIIITASRTPKEVEQISRTQLNEEYFIGVIPNMSSEMTYASFMHYNDDVVYLNSNKDDFYVKITGNRLHPMIGTDRNNRLALKQHQVRLNGFRLQMPFHTTIVPAMNPAIVNYDLIQKSNYHTSVFDVEYADAYESVMDLHYRKGNPNRISGKAMIDLLNLSFMIEGPLTRKASWIIDGKKSYTRDLLDLIQKSKWMSYDYYDFQAQLDFQPVDQQNIRINYIYSTDQTSFNPQINYNRERMMFNSSSSLPSLKILTEEDIQEMNLNNNRFNLNGISANDIYQISNQWKSEFTVSYTEQRYHNKWAWSVEHNILLPEITDISYNYLWSEGKKSYFWTKSWEEKFILHYLSSPAYSMKAGIHFEQLQYNARMENNLLVRIDKNVSEPPNYNRAFNNTKKINKYSCFYQEERCLFDKLKIQTGVRYDHFDLQQKDRLNPRIVISYDLPNEIKTRAAFGTFSRLPEFGEIQQHMLERFKPGYKPGNSKIEFQYINKYMVGIEKTFVPYVFLEFNCVYKNMKNLIPIQRLSDGSLFYDVKNRASASSRGFDINARLNFHRLSLMSRYKYTDSFEQIPYKRNYTFYADQRHSLFLSLSVTLPHDWYIGLQANYGSGYAYTPCVLPEFDWELGYDLDSTPMWEYQTDSPNSARYPGYGRLDIIFRKGFTMPVGKITMSVNLLNLLNTRHTFSYIYTYNQNGQPIQQSESLMPFFPQVGLAYEF
jgi:hypothetical protein